MKAFACEGGMETWPTGPAGQPAAEDLRHGRLDLFGWLALYRDALAAGRDRKHLLAVFDAASGCVSAHFRSREALSGQLPWPDIDQRVAHRRIEADLAAHRARLAGSAPLDAADCAHMFDALLVQFVRECPLS